MMTGQKLMAGKGTAMVGQMPAHAHPGYTYGVCVFICMCVYLSNHR